MDHNLVNQTQEKINYCLYARKSSEQDERQAMSIDSQIKEMKDLAQIERLHIKEIRHESHSAKQSSTRPVFIKLIEDIKSGYFNGILTWAPDRLSRNAGDLGQIVDLMDQKRLTQIRTFSQTFSDNPNEKFLLMILCSQAKLENDQKGLNVKRGIRAKCEMGWRPGIAPIGYFNRTFAGVRDIIIDNERAPLVSEMFQRVATRGDSGRTIKQWIDKTNFTSRGGKRMSLSQVYLTLKNPFYYGEFEFPVNSGNWYKGKHKPLISKKIFNQIQRQLETSEKPKWGAKSLPFRGLFICAGCGGGTVGEEKYRKLLNGGYRHHIYYHCSRAKDYQCKEGYVNQRVIIQQLIKLIKSLDSQKLKLSKKLREKLDNFSKVQNMVLMQNNLFTNKKSEDLQRYATYVLFDGQDKEKRELMQGLNLKLYLKNKQIYNCVE